MYSTTLCFLVKRDKDQAVLLGRKKTGFGQGKYNGFGGKLKAGESVKQAAVREVYEECGLQVAEDSLQEVGYLDFLFPQAPEWNHDVYIYLSEQWEGQEQETEEMVPEWVSFTKIPYDQMWKDDCYWLGRALQGEAFRGTVTFAEDNEEVESVHIQWANEGSCL